MSTAIEFQHVSKSFGDTMIIPNMDLEIEEGELFVLVGTSGSGKTTSLKMVNRLEEPTDGDILINGKKAKDYPLQQLRWSMGYILQQIALFPTMTVAQNIAVIPEMKKVPKKEINRLVDELLTKVGLEPAKYRDRMPRELSGGEQQRIGILRAIASKPDIVLMDEPFGALDPLSRTTLQDLILELHKELNNTIIFVTHDMDEAVKVGDRIGIMGDGELLQVGTPEELAENPTSDFVRDFFGSSVDKNSYQTPISHVAQTEGYDITTDENIAAVQLQEDVTLQEAFAAFSEYDHIKVVNEQQEFLGYLSRKQIFQYLSK
ncbi:ABC transporter ATP-binding protein [Tetragenococcus koreensis]|uniref:ABC-type quaternary amine transporter n=1 Tax=Tetragenococcus koreensis TaxID=290335 RepID=A0AAN4UBE2_9ENTE|nr:ABC transporter ATP-binding protein [Tetragenococcus koreensis]AYW45681.1 ABC transporter ATP-binding protein [Tetragenococcus koreensis]MCF1584852.1 ABC transporter ATP-binding protein [Tetragenococcus koreensis]MCF1614400.1 ABC transporter ATP-binding protein [Tetragenococcus koreensis]MCF1617008.1 ABC transporter ATP-binding protein [Tetragenococcus koreensis]MCF1619894.1 ABC transporter ATP-binding protein [Tetragenococcus koreensis]